MKIFKTLIILTALFSLISCGRKVVTVPIYNVPVAEVAEVIKEEPVKVERVTVINIKESIMFAHNSDNIEIDEATKIEDVAYLMKEYPDTVVAIKGFASTEGVYEYNLELSKKRAIAVQNAFVAEGIEKERILLSADGETDEFGDLLELNRRVLIINFE